MDRMTTRWREPGGRWVHRLDLSGVVCGEDGVWRWSTGETRCGIALSEARALVITGDPVDCPTCSGPEPIALIEARAVVEQAWKAVA